MYNPFLDLAVSFEEVKFWLTLTFIMSAAAFISYKSASVIAEFREFFNDYIECAAIGYSDSKLWVFSVCVVYFIFNALFLAFVMTAIAIGPLSLITSQNWSQLCLSICVMAGIPSYVKLLNSETSPEYVYS